MQTLMLFFFCERFLYVSPRSNNYEVSVKIVMPFRCWHAKQLYLIPLKMTICLLYLSCSTRPPPHPPPPPLELITDWVFSQGIWVRLVSYL